MATKKQQLGFLALVITIIAGAITGIVLTQNNLSITIKPDSATFKSNVDGWKTVGIEKLYLDGILLSGNISQTRYSDNRTEITRTNSLFNDKYSFDGSLSNVESFPVSHEIHVLNSKGKQFKYVVSSLKGVTAAHDVRSGEKFGYAMKVTFDDGYTTAKVTKAGTMTVVYTVPSNDWILNVRLFDPPCTTINGSMNISTSITFCTGNYTFNASDYQSYFSVKGLFLTKANNIVIDCNYSNIIATNNSVVIFYSGQTNVTYLNCIFSGTPSRTFTFEGAKNLNISNCIFNASSASTARIYFDQATTGTVFNNSFLNSATYSDMSVYASNNLSILNNNFYNDTVVNINLNGLVNASNILISGNSFNNYLSRAITKTSYHENVTISNNIFNGNTQLILISAQNNTVNIINNTLIGNQSLLRVESSNNVNIINNSCTGLPSVYNYCFDLPSGNNLLIQGNSFTGTQQGIQVQGTNISIIGNTFFNMDKGIDAHNFYTAIIRNNNFSDINTFYDGYDLPIAISKGNNIIIDNNSLSKIYTTGIWLQGVNNTQIYNNKFDFLSNVEKKTYAYRYHLTTTGYKNSSDWLQSPSAILLAWRYKSYDTLGTCDYNVNFNLSCYLNMGANNTNITIANNTFDGDTQVYLISQGSTYTSDLRNYWYRNVTPFSNYTTPIEYYINPSISSITLINLSGEVDGIIGSGYEFRTTPVAYTISKSSMTFAVNPNVLVNWSLARINTTTNITVYSGYASMLPFNDARNQSNNLTSNFDTYSKSISIGEILFIGFFNTSAHSNKNLTISGILCPLNDTCIVSVDFDLGTVTP